MSNINKTHVALEGQQVGSETLFQEFEEVAKAVGSPATSLGGIKRIFKEWLSLNFTNLMQQRGFNKKKIANINKQEQVILNIGCLGDENNQYLNADIFRVYGDWGLISVWRFLTAKDKMKYDLLLNLTLLDPNLIQIADAIILSHVLEHIHPQSAITALKNCFEYLKPEGYIRIAVPYLEAYSAPELPDCQGITYPILAKNKLIYGWRHCFMYDAPLLKILLEKAGFSEIEQVKFGEGILKETDLPAYQKESIYLTAKKLK